MTPDKNLDKKIVPYWQHCANLHALMQASMSDLQNIGKAISLQECEHGKISDQAVVEALLAQGNIMVIAPFVAAHAAVHDKKLESHFFSPYYLLVELGANGKFIVQRMLALPLIPKNALESALLQPIVLGAAEQFDNYLAINQPAWHEEPEQLTWTAQLSYAEQLLSEVTAGQWWEDLQQLGFARLPQALILPLATLTPKLEVAPDVLDSIGSIELVSAERGSGKSEYARSLVVDAWVEAAVKQAPPPEYVWLQYGQKPQYASILDDRTPASADSITQIHDQLRYKFNTYHKGRQLLRNWQEVSHNLQQLYAEYGGIKLRHKQLEDQHATVKANSRLLQVLNSIWQRQLELVPSWTKPLDFIRVMQRQRLQRLYKFFKHNFPDQDVTNLTQAQMIEILNAKINSVAHSERCKADAVHQVANDMQQESLLRTKLDQWERQHNYDIAGAKLWDEIVTLTKQYWRKYFDQHPEYAQFLLKDPEQINTLIIEHAEYLSPMTTVALLAKARRAVIMGSYDDTLLCPSFSPLVDFELAQGYDLVSCDADFEDLQFDGLLGSLGNMWNFAAAGREADQHFNKRDIIKADYTIINIDGLSQGYLGSRVNFAEIDAIVQWLQENSKTTWRIGIYTNFSGQRECLRNSLAEAGFGRIPIHLIQEPCFQEYDVVLFSPVYCGADSGPYNFDRGEAMLNNMRVNTRRRLILVGDAQIFKPQLHSASGKFARLFVKEEVVHV